MTTVVVFFSSLLWLVIGGSVIALFRALIAWLIVRWNEHCPVVFNRVYLACLVWSLPVVVLIAGVAAHEKHFAPASALMRGMAIMDMVLGVLALWRLVPRADARRIGPASACMAVAVNTVIGIGLVFALIASKTIP